jgi:LysR family transcriptional regulator, hydrogen peroxide-inducible genes activator
MEIHSIKYCLAVFGERSFTRAARRCKVAQPSLSNGIQKLERELGGALFVRDVNGIELTLLGRAVRPHFEEIDKRIERIRKISSNLANADAARRKA